MHLLDQMFKEKSIKVLALTKRSRFWGWLVESTAISTSHHLCS